MLNAVRLSAVANRAFPAVGARIWNELGLPVMRLKARFFSKSSRIFSVGQGP